MKTITYLSDYNLSMNTGNSRIYCLYIYNELQDASKFKYVT